MNVVYQKLLVNVTSEKYIYKNVFIESSCQFSFLRCQEYDFKDFVDGENYAVWRTGFKIEQSIECQSLTQVRCITEF